MFTKIRTFAVFASVFLILGFSRLGPAVAHASGISFTKSLAANTSLNWAGYLADKGKFTGVGASWVIPAVAKSAKTKTDSAWVGIGGVKTNDLIQLGTDAITGRGGQITYEAWYEMLPDYSRPLPVSVNSGDLVSVQISEAGKNKFRLSFINQTTGQKFEKVSNYSSTLSSAEWIEEMPSNGNEDLMALDNFKRVKFSNAFAVLNGKRVNIADSGARSVSMATPAGKMLAVSSKLSANGSSFEVKRMSGILARNSAQHGIINSRLKLPEKYKWQKLKQFVPGKFWTAEVGLQLKQK